jgi:CRISPR-associated protein Csx17
VTTSKEIPLPGCRHDVLGHALKAIGVLRALCTCASPADCDPSAEGWWNPNGASFIVHSAHHPEAESLVKFFAEKYRPTAIIAAWNKSGGVTDKIEVTISCRVGDVSQFRANHEATLESFGLKKSKKLSKTRALVFTLSDSTKLNELVGLASAAGLVCSHKEKQLRGNLSTQVTIASGTDPLERFRSEHSDTLAQLGFGSSKKLSAAGQLKFSTDSTNRPRVEDLVGQFNASFARTLDDSNPGDDAEPQNPDGPLKLTIIAKETGKKDGVLPNVARLLSDDQVFQQCLELARQYVIDLQGAGDEDAVGGDVFLRYRDKLPALVTESFDALCTLHLSRDNDNPLFIRRGRPGDKVNADIFLNFWDYFIAFRKSPEAFARACLFNERVVGSGINPGDQKGKGTPFFPDAIKSYNQGLDWVIEDYPFCPLDYILAVEGALAMRGATSKTLSARSRTRAAFPFVFEGTETMTDEQGKSLKLTSSFWLPIWTRPTTYEELQSFILDSQARLPSKDCRFSSDFARAARSQDVDAGFFAFQEFRFKLKGANVPWTTAGRFVPCSGNAASNVLNELLAPVDESGFLNQFEFARESKNDLHPLRAPLLEAIEEAVAEPDANKILDVLRRLAELNAHLAKSKTLREKIGTGRVTFVPPLRCENWSETFGDLDSEPEFEIARALASIRGRERQPDGTFSKTESFLGSLLPLQRSQRNWFLPDPPSPQAVWTGIDLTRDLSAVLARRVIDSAADFRPALVGTCTARLATVLAFLSGELNDTRIARMVEALSLIDWQTHSVRHQENSAEATEEEHLAPLPVAYASLRALIEIACHAEQTDGVANIGSSAPRAVVQRAISLVTGQEPRMVATGVSEALRRLAIVSVPNTYGSDSRKQKPKLSGREVVSLGRQVQLQCDPVLSQRLAGAILVPLDWRDYWQLFRAVTLPQTT